MEGVLAIAFVLTVVGLGAYQIGTAHPREALLQKERAEAVAECSHDLVDLQDRDATRCTPASYQLAVHDAHRVVVRRWLAELDVDGCDTDAVIEGLRRRDADPVRRELVGTPRRSWLLNQKHVSR